MNMRLARGVGLVLGSALTLQMFAVAESSPLDTAASSSAAASSSSNRPSDSLPDAPSMVAQQQAQPAPGTAGNPPADQGSKPAPQQPKGAAAAEVQRSTGTAASTPSGAAIAPAKQKRTRSLLIRMGALAGAGIAIGTVVALSSGSPSKPPGAN